ncbi:MAG: hypothetical protein A3B99_02320 [Candidatus Yanofskybacteria bacterium RIFCSPHIGHO2_02_FULL_44_12b]|uniref:UPF0102 protein A2925_03345 n=2 Tax=Candidatus Yanofskyibacteriota TaxID=1752733 RepID=A0A1F8GPG4_9BACT|nr:MAG: hypothetical protein UW79_C0037G0015 [Candidatus Yanofskybacteria bacterium GW2011_GWA2_44_9]OGN05529.1 MAG: hypothetical protein A2659_02980 [Candidatus Yanofskybacteria bacterium RIFCSPHIGHO2_01_FULL_44_24]OGN14620.1 MAG: hypothetical protein A3B99_02320 [Candidatus Yanofskybacteria bacterium RIFCSPHIGHO2_02_FULL_44_12b]OGN26548.1 MAG: hypothetical protein A2925_03345 [Candidatus Yanofskybacteria bacterium RIFCSPLOWO2_01_FULL_44_22]
MTKISEIGFIAEGYVAQYLASKGYRILAQNYKKPWGEIDLIVEKDEVLVFVEVKANTADIAGFEPETRADREKMKKVVRTAQTYLTDKKIGSNQEWQVDIISLVFDKNRGVAKIKHFKNVEI